MFKANNKHTRTTPEFEHVNATVLAKRFLLKILIDYQCFLKHKIHRQQNNQSISK